MTKSFEEFIKQGVVKKVKEDSERAKNLVVEAGRKINSLKEKLEKIGVKDENANDYVEYCYDILMFLVRAKMLLKGYSASGFGAHEAEVSYMRKLGFNETNIQFADQLRYFRNGILYYGTRLDKEYAKKVIDFLKKAKKKLDNYDNIKQKDLNILREIFNRHDPVRIYANKYTNFDEYNPEIKEVLMKFKEVYNLDNFTKEIHKIFIKMFDEKIAGPIEKYKELAKEVYDYLNKTMAKLTKNEKTK